MSLPHGFAQRVFAADYIPFLDYPHAHDPMMIDNLAALSIDLLQNLPQAVQDALRLLQESTSVMYASYLRLQQLIDEKFDRLNPLPGQDICSYPPFPPQSPLESSVF
jgi:hypothetical protein